MSEEKIIKHAHKAVHIAEDRSKPWRHKIKELLEEILIIIVAVSITLAFHNWNDWRSERKIEKEFLAGTSDDLKKSAQLVDAGIRDMSDAAKYYDNVWQQIKTNKIDAAYIDTNSYQLITTSYFVFDNGRYEGFKSSGYLRLIENQALLKDITTLFTLIIPFQQHADEMGYSERVRTYYQAIGIKAPIDNNKLVHVSKILNDPAVRYQIVNGSSFIHERVMQKKDLASEMRRVAGEIDKELNK